MSLLAFGDRFLELLRDERGGASGETLIYIPLFLAAVFVLSDATVLYRKHAEMWTAARDAARGLALNALDAAEAADRVQAHLADFEGEVQVAVDPGQVIIIEVTSDFSGESIFGFIGELASRTPARVIMRREPRILDRLG